jgi:hypothetical protein
MNAKSPLKSIPLRNPGQGLDEELDRLVNDKALWYLLLPLIVWLLVGIEWFSRLRHLPRMPGVYALMAVALTVFCAWRFWQIRGQVRRVRLGRDGEKVVGQFLQGLQVEGLRVFHDVQGGEGFNLDHVVICERGVFVIETKTWSKPRPTARVAVNEGQVFKDGRPADRDPIGQVVTASKWLAMLLEEGTGKRFAVQGVVVFPGWFVEPMDPTTKALAWVLEPKALPAWIEREPVRLKLEELKIAAYFLGRYVRGKE